MSRGKRFRIGHTAITWGYGPKHTQQALQDVAEAGFHSIECFGGALEYWEQLGGMDKLLEASGLKLHGVYCPVNLLNPAKRSDLLDTMITRAKLLRKYGGSVAVIGPDMVDRSQYTFSEHKTDIVTALDELARALADEGVTAALHQHKNSCIETHDELYTVMNAVNTEFMKLCPDFGHLYNGGMDPRKVVQDFLSLVAHVHIKDYGGGEAYNGFCPLGKGKVDIAGILEVLETSDKQPNLMAELNPPPDTVRLTPLKLVRMNRSYLEKLGYQFIN